MNVLLSVKRLKEKVLRSLSQIIYNECYLISNNLISAALTSFKRRLRHKQMYAYIPNFNFRRSVEIKEFAEGALIFLPEVVQMCFLRVILHVPFSDHSFLLRDRTLIILSLSANEGTETQKSHSSSFSS